MAQPERARAPGNAEGRTTVEFSRGGKDDTAITWPATLVVDRARDRIGVRTEDGQVYQVPLSHVLELLRGSVV